jgi:hypothetical protein
VIFTLVVCSVAEPPLLDLKKAAEAGDPIARKQLAHRYEKAMNYSEAELWYRKIALTGDPEVLQALGRMYCDQKLRLVGPVPAHGTVTNGLALVTLAAVQGHKSSQRDLAYAFHNGKLVPRDRVRAYQLFRLSGSPGDKYLIDRMILEMPTAEVDQAEAEAKAFKPRPFREAFIELTRGTLQLQGIAGSKGKQFAIINGQTVEPGKTITIEVASIPVPIRCDTIDKSSVVLSFLGATALLQVPGITEKSTCKAGSLKPTTPKPAVFSSRLEKLP